MNEDDDDVQWTDHARDQFRAATVALVGVIQEHSRVLLAMTGRQADYPVLFESGDRLAEAAEAFADAQFELSGTWPSFEVDDEDDDEGDADEDEQDPPARISVLHRADYRVVDPVALMEAGRQAYRQAWPDNTDEDATEDVSHLGRALYQVMHAGGLAALGHTPGLSAGGSQTWFVEADELLDECTDRDPLDNPFPTDGEALREKLLYGLGEHFGGRTNEPSS